MKLTNDRKWFLKKFGDFGWQIAPPMLSGIKKWDAHLHALIKMGFVETDGEEMGTMYRITEAGKAALEGGE